jgi:hypothetical protein
MFRFTIRDVLWLTVVVALAVCWGLDRVQLRREQVNARRAELRARMKAEMALANAELARASVNYWTEGIELAKPVGTAKRQAAATAP